MVSKKFLLLLGLLVIIGLGALLLGKQYDGKQHGALSPSGQFADSRDPAPPPTPSDRQPLPAPGIPADVPRDTTQGQSPPQPPAGPPLIAFENGELTLAVTKYPLQTILREITRKSGIPIFCSDTLGNPLITMQFERLPIAQGLERLLKSFDVFYFHRGGALDFASIGGIWVYPEGAGTEIVPVTAAEWASTKEMEESINASDPNKRAQALETLVERKGDEALGLVFQALKDPDEAVRYRTLIKAVGSGLTLPPGFFLDLLQFDRSFGVRIIALEALLKDPNASSEWLKTVAEVAANDPSPELRELALESLSQLGNLDRSRVGEQNLQAKEGRAQERLSVESGSLP
jgi:hypothetical protein